MVFESGMAGYGEEEGDEEEPEEKEVEKEGEGMSAWLKQ